MRKLYSKNSNFADFCEIKIESARSQMNILIHNNHLKELNTYEKIS